MYSLYLPCQASDIPAPTPPPCWDWSPVPLPSLTCVLFTLPVEVLPSLLLAKEILQDGDGNGQHHGGGGGVAQPHGQEGGGHHHSKDEPGEWRE